MTQTYLTKAWNRLANTLSRSQNKQLLQHALDYEARLKEFLKQAEIVQSEHDQLATELRIVKEKLNKYEALTTLFVPLSITEAITDSEYCELKRLNAGHYYAVGAFIKDVGLIGDIAFLKKQGFRFKSGMNREEMKVKVDNCHKKILKNAIDSKQPSKSSPEITGTSQHS